MYGEHLKRGHNSSQVSLCRGYVVRKKAYLSRFYLARFNKPWPFIAADIHCNSLSMMPDHQKMFAGTINYILDIDGTVESPNQFLNDRVICSTDSERNDYTL